MGETVSRGREAGRRAEVPAATGARELPGRVRWVALGIVAVVAAGTVAGWRAGVFSPAASSGAGQATPATAVVARQGIAATTPLTATLGYAGTYPVTGRGSGTLTWLPSAGQVISQGQAVYKTGNGSPVVLLYGTVPDWRPLDEGVTGADVTQLNHDLVALGDAGSAEVSAAGWDYFSAETAAGVQKLQSALGISSPPGSLSLGQVVFEPGALRVSQVTESLGAPASGPVLATTSDRHVVTIPLDAAMQSQVTAGDKVTVTLPDGSSTPGTVSSVGTVASGPGSNATIPVTVNITTASAKNALVVPVAALLAQSVKGDGEAGGGYAVEVVEPGGTHELVAVTLGLFDDAGGTVQVSGAGLDAGQHVVVPAQ